MATLIHAQDNNCEQGATNMAEVYACLKSQRDIAVEDVYVNLMEALAARGMSDAQELLEDSQSAWAEDNNDYCGVLIEIARPSWSLYSQDLFSNCQSERVAQRITALELLHLALEKGQFEQWTASPTSAYTASNGQQYIANQNDHGAALTNKYETIYLGNSCDALSDAGEEGTWAWANGGFLIVFPERRIGFPRQDQPVSGGYHCQM